MIPERIKPGITGRRTFGPPRGMESDVIPLDCCDDGESLSTYWKPSLEELEALEAGAHVRLRIYGGQHPPVSIEVS